MSFVFPSWETAFSPAFHEDAKAMLEGALNKGNKPPVIQGRIEVVELSMGTQPPTLTLLEIGDLSLDRFRGILRLGYQGDAWLEVRCRVQANPLSHNPNLLPSSTLPLSTPLLASQPLLVPMTLRLSKLHLRAILILVVSASKGITLVFKNDPLQNVDVSSTFDSVEVIRGYLQQEIEGQLREMFREDLPGIIHRLSQRWFTGTGVGGKVEMPYRDNNVDYGIGTPGRYDESDDEEESNDPYAEKPLFPPRIPASTSSPSPSNNLTPRRKSLQQAVRARRSSAISESPTSYTVFPDIEDYDPTYGLRPEGLPTHSGYEAFGRLWERARVGEGRGLGSLMSLHRVGEDEAEDLDLDSDLDLSLEREEDRGDVSDADWDDPANEDEDETRSFDLVEMDDSLRALGPNASAAGVRASRSRRASRIAEDEEDYVEWETFPAVGGGVITRPRVYHVQSQIRAPSEAGGAMPSPSGTATGGSGSVTARASSVGGASSTIGSLRMGPMTPTPASSHYTRATPGPGPSSLRRMVTSRSDIFLGASASSAHRADVLTPLPTSGSYKSFHPRMPASPLVSSVAGSQSRSHKHSQSQYQSHSQYQPQSQYQSQSQAQSHSRSRSNPPLSRRQSHAASSSAARTSGSSWDRDTDKAPTRSGTMSTMASSQLPSSKSMSIPTAKITSPQIGLSTGGAGGPLVTGAGAGSRAGTGAGNGHGSGVGVGVGVGVGLGLRQRATSITSTSPGSFPPRHIGPGGITLPLNNSVSQLATLSHSAHTLSPYARAHEHIAVRSFPHLGKSHSGSSAGNSSVVGGAGDVGKGNVKARRKRIYQLGGKKGVEDGDGGGAGVGVGIGIGEIPSAPLSPDLDGSSPGSAPSISITHTRGPAAAPPYTQASARRRKAGLIVSPNMSGSASFSSDEPVTPWAKQPSLTGIAARVMARPNYGRSPDSRTSYGFPPSRSVA